MTPIDFALLLDESGSMKRPKPDGSLEGPGGLKALAKQLVSQFSLGEDATRFAVVSFAADATTRVPWSYDAAEINTGIDEMTADGKTSISDGFAAVRQLFADDVRSELAAKVVLLVSDGEQSNELAAPGKTPAQTAIDAAELVKEDGVIVFTWGFGAMASLATLEQIATDPSKALLAHNVAQLWGYLYMLQTAVLQAAGAVIPFPPPPPPSNSPPPPPGPPSPSPPPPLPSPQPPSPSPPSPSPSTAPLPPPSPPPPSPSSPSPPPSPPPPKGCTASTAENYRPFAVVDDGSCIQGGCMDSRFDSFNPSATFNDGSCPPVLIGCMQSDAVNYRALANVESGRCLYEGCMDPAALNYDPSADLPKECIPRRYGCLDSHAMNYRSYAHTADDTCRYAGCTDPSSTNYNPSATFNDGSCLPRFRGCTNSRALNYQPDANWDDKSCRIVGCKATDPSATINIPCLCTGACSWR